MISGYKHISFDLDGTLVHTMTEYRHKMISAVVKELGGNSNPQSIDEFWFRPDRSKLVLEQFGVDPDLFWKTFGLHDTAEHRKPFTVVYPDVIPILKKINELRKTISIITGAPQWIADVEIAKLEGVSIAHSLALNGSRFVGKPCSDSMNHVLSELGHKPEETIYIGNGAEDALFAEAIGCAFVLVDRGEYPVIHHRPLPTIKTLDELFLSV